MRLAARLLAVPVLVAASAARAEDPPAPKRIDNPTYASWAKFPVGTYVKLETKTGVEGGSMTAVHKLVELTADKAVIETTMTTAMAGQSFALPAQRRTEPKSIEVPAMPPTGAPKPEVKEGTGEVTTPAGTFSCRWAETKMVIQGTTSVSKVWQADNVPGGVVKMEATVNIAGMPPQNSTTTLIELKKP